MNAFNLKPASPVAPGQPSEPTNLSMTKPDEAGAENKDATAETAEQLPPEVTQAPFTPKIYSCHPVQNFSIAGFEFVKGTLTLSDPESVAKFEAELAWFEKHQPTTRAMIRTLDLEAANRFAAAFRPDAMAGAADSSMVRAATVLAAAIPNTGELAPSPAPAASE